MAPEQHISVSFGPWLSRAKFIEEMEALKSFITEGFATLGGQMAATQADVDALAAQLSEVGTRLSTGVDELQAEVVRLQDTLSVDLTPLQDKLAPLSAIADELGSDNVPAAPDTPAEPNPPANPEPPVNP